MREKGVYPRTRKQSTGLFSAPLRVAVLFNPIPQNKNRPQA